MAGIRKKTVRHQWYGGIPAPAGWIDAEPVDEGPAERLTSRHVVRRAGTGATAVACGGTGCAGFDGDEDVAADWPDDSMKRPKIILPAVVCSTLVTTTSM